MFNLNDKNVSEYNMENCFGFDEDNIDLFWHNSSVVSNAGAFLEFQENKPYRLALYVRPNDRKRLNTTSILNSAKKKTQKSKPNKIEGSKYIMAKFLNSNDSKTIVKNGRKNKVMLFDENTKPNNNEKQDNLTDEVKKNENQILKNSNSSKKNILVETNNKSLPRSKQYKVRRSYERKCKNQKQEVVIERSSSDIIKELELKKLSRTKLKKPSKEDQEFEKWAKDVNSDFSDVDKFELSITYD